MAVTVSSMMDGKGSYQYKLVARKGAWLIDIASAFLAEALALGGGPMHECNRQRQSRASGRRQTRPSKDHFPLSRKQGANTSVVVSSKPIHKKFRGPRLTG